MHSIYTVHCAVTQLSLLGRVPWRSWNRTEEKAHETPTRIHCTQGLHSRSLHIPAQRVLKSGPQIYTHPAADNAWNKTRTSSTWAQCDQSKSISTNMRGSDTTTTNTKRQSKKQPTTTTRNGMVTRQEMIIQEPGTNGGRRSGKHATRINENCHAKGKKN